jgi:hypothetical protein
VALLLGDNKITCTWRAVVSLLGQSAALKKYNVKRTAGVEGQSWRAWKTTRNAAVAITKVDVGIDHHL